jgi:GNAT superfamily N-acetyltransferase
MNYFTMNSSNVDLSIRELNGITEMLQHFEVIQELYPTLTIEAYEADLKAMLPNNSYGQVAVFSGEECIGISGFWVGTKLWCGKYLELDNIIVSAKHRSKGAGKLMIDYLYEKAQQQGCSMMALDSYTTNFAAHKLFYNEGFGPKGFHFIRVLKDDMLR